MVINVKYKIFILGLLLFVLCGCSVNYDLIIDNNNYYYETTTISSTGNEEYSKEYLYNLYLEEYPIYESEEYLYYDPTERVEGNTYYDKSIIDNNYGYSAIYKAKYDNDSYKDSRALNTAFGEYKIGYDPDNEYYYLELNNLNIFDSENYINKININITVSNNYIVVENNASNVNGNIYSWSFDKVDSELILKYQKKSVYDYYQTHEHSKPIEEEEEKEDNKNTTTIIIIALIAFLGYLLFIIGIISSKKNKK